MSNLHSKTVCQFFVLLHDIPVVPKAVRRLLLMKPFRLNSVPDFLFSSVIITVVAVAIMIAILLTRTWFVSINFICVFFDTMINRWPFPPPCSGKRFSLQISFHLSEKIVWNLRKQHVLSIDRQTIGFVYWLLVLWNVLWMFSCFWLERNSKRKSETWQSTRNGNKWQIILSNGKIKRRIFYCLCWRQMANKPTSWCVSWIQVNKCVWECD